MTHYGTSYRPAIDTLTPAFAYVDMEDMVRRGSTILSTLGQRFTSSQLSVEDVANMV